MTSSRYFDLVDRLVALADDPPWTERAHEQARRVLPPAPRPRLEAAPRPGPSRRPADLPPTTVPVTPTSCTDVRKAAKRVRYAAEALLPLYGEDAMRMVRAHEQIQTALGDHHDGTEAQVALLELGERATAAGENAFTYGLLHARIDARRASPLASSSEPGDAPGGLVTGTGSAERPLLRVGWRPATEPSAADRLLADLVTWHVGTTLPIGRRCASLREHEPRSAVRRARPGARQPRPRTGPRPGRRQHGRTGRGRRRAGRRRRLPRVRRRRGPSSGGAPRPHADLGPQGGAPQGHGLGASPSTPGRCGSTTGGWSRGTAASPLPAGAAWRTCPSPRRTSGPSR